ncbi:hypothetical protein OC842_000071 [Tilletia horrida]|uniref:Uncharacterized protein n=1 Tax=Tilletia horrida TaxID=155126 RepID=A0AAN6GJY8_9BASI|nr:hypothetical protein OC842_000071 [Tilletia horrida]
MTKDGSTRGLRSIFGRRRRVSQEYPALTPLTIYQPAVSAHSAQGDAPQAFPAHKIYPSTSENLEELFGASPGDHFGPPAHRERRDSQEEETLEMLEDDESDDDYNALSPSNSSGDIGGARPSRRSRAFSRPQPPSAVSGNPGHPTSSRQRERTDSISGASISSVRSWKSIFRLSQAPASERKEGSKIKRIGSLASIRSLAISSPVAVQASTSAAVEIGSLPPPAPPLRARASSPAMSSSARFDGESATQPLRNALDMDDAQMRRQLLHSAVSYASQSPTMPPRKQGERSEGLRKRSSSIASLSSLLGAAIGLGSRGKERASVVAPAPPTPGIALSNSITSFTILSAPQPPPLTPTRRSVLKPVTVQPAAPAVSGQASGADLGCAPKHSLASSGDANGKSSKRWKLRNRRKTAEVTAQTLKAMTQSRAVELDEARQGATASSVSLASSSALGATLHSQLEPSPPSPAQPSPTTASSHLSDEKSPVSSGLFVNVGRWATQVGGRARLSSSNSAYSQSSDAVSSQPGASSNIYSPGANEGGSRLLPAAGIHFSHQIGGSPGALGIPESEMQSRGSSPASLNHWLMDLDLNLRRPQGTSASGKNQAPSANLQVLLDSPRMRGVRSNAFDDLLSVQSNNGSAESVVFLIKPTAEPMSPDADAAGPQPQLSRRNTKDSVRNSLRGVPTERRPLSTQQVVPQDAPKAIQREETVTQALHKIQELHSPSPVKKGPSPPQRSSSRPQLPTRTSAVSQLCSLRSDMVSASYDDETEVVVQVDETGSAKPSESAPSCEDAQDMESQQVDPWGSFDAHLGLVADSDSAAAVLASMSESMAAVSAPIAIVPSVPASFEPKAKVTSSSTLSDANKSDLPYVTASESVSADRSAPASDQPNMTRPSLDKSSLSELSADISATSDDVEVATKVVIAAVALSTLPAALIKAGTEGGAETQVKGNDASSQSPALPSQATVTELANAAAVLVGATVEQVAAVTASLANLGSMSMISNASSILMARNSLEVPEPVTPSEPMATPSLASHSFGSTDSADEGSDMLHEISHRAVLGGPLEPLDAASTPLKPKALLEEAEHFDQWGSAPNGLLLDLSINGKPSPQHFEEAVQNFKERQRERERTHTAGNEGWAELSPLLGYNTVLSIPAAAAALDIDNLNELSPVKISASRLNFSLAASSAAEHDSVKPMSSRSSAPQRLTFAMPRHKSGNALDQPDVHPSATMPTLLAHRLALETKRTSLPGTVVTLADFLSELKTPVDVGCPPPPPLIPSRRAKRSRTLDVTGVHSRKRTFEPSLAEEEEDYAMSKTATKKAGSHHRRARTISTSTPLRMFHRRFQLHDDSPSFRTSATDDEVEDATADGSFTRAEWQQFAAGLRRGPLLRASDGGGADADASHRAVHSKSPPPPAATSTTTIATAPAILADAEPATTASNGALLALIEDYDDDEDEDVDEDKVAEDRPSAAQAAIPQGRGAEAPRSSTPAPTSGTAPLFDSPSTALLTPLNGPHTSKMHDSTSDLSGGGMSSEAPSTALARCHSPLMIDEDDDKEDAEGREGDELELEGDDDEDDADASMVANVSCVSHRRRSDILSGSPVPKHSGSRSRSGFGSMTTTSASAPLLRMTMTLPPSDLLDGEELKMLGACLSLIAISSSSGGSSPLSSASSGLAQEAEGGRIGGEGHGQIIDFGTPARGPASPSASSVLDSSTSASGPMNSSGGTGGAAFISADLTSSSSETEASTIDIVEHLLRKAMWARYDKARREMMMGGMGGGVAAAAAAVEAAEAAQTDADADAESEAEAEAEAEDVRYSVGGSALPPIPLLAVTDVDVDLELD